MCSSECVNKKYVNSCCNLMKRHDAKRTLNSWGTQIKCAVDDGRDHEITTTDIDGKKNFQTLIDWGKNLWLTLCEKMLLQFRVASYFPLFLLEYRVILGKEKGKSRKGKNYQIRKRKNTHQIFDISSPPEYELSVRESKKVTKK